MYAVELALVIAAQNSSELSAEELLAICDKRNATNHAMPFSGKVAKPLGQPRLATVRRHVSTGLVTLSSSLLILKREVAKPVSGTVGM